jgi:hypothetical protein
VTAYQREVVARADQASDRSWPLAVPHLPGFEGQFYAAFPPLDHQCVAGLRGSRKPSAAETRILVAVHFQNYLMASI